MCTLYDYFYSNRSVEICQWHSPDILVLFLLCKLFVYYHALIREQRYIGEKVKGEAEDKEKVKKEEQVEEDEDGK